VSFAPDGRSSWRRRTAIASWPSSRNGPGRTSPIKRFGSTGARSTLADGVVEETLTDWPKGGEPTTVTYRLRMYTASELKRMALEAGFADVEFYGDVAGGPLSRDSCLVLVAKAP
jgi:hypothetical protein